ncbi:MAG: diaminopimelate epimerase [Saprospiraceae bacterium]
MKIPFVKYQGTGNDFVIIDQRDSIYLRKEDTQKIAFLCDRRFGIGADGLMIIEKSNIAAFEMIYFNADGRESSMCGNGGRCIAHLAKNLGLFEWETTFLAIDGLHEVSVDQDVVSLKMKDVVDMENVGELAYTLHTGSPHYVQIVDSIPHDIAESGKKIRYNEVYAEEGINVNFAQYDQDENTAIVATYERGVEDETLSCGTGVTAAALVCSEVYGAVSPVEIITKGGKISVSFEKSDHGYKNIYLIGPATFVFLGEIYIED